MLDPFKIENMGQYHVRVQWAYSSMNRIFRYERKDKGLIPFKPSNAS